MTAASKLAFVGLFALSALSDVAPRCGGRREPTIVVVQPGEHCGWEGPRRRVDCAAPAQCMRHAGGQICSAACETDHDCAKLGADWTCTSKGRGIDGEPASELSICGRGPSEAGAPRFAPPPPSSPTVVDPG